MKNFILPVILIWFAVLPGGARTMKQLFAEMPDSILPVLSKSSRLDGIDYLESGMKASVKNYFGEPSRLKVLTADYISIDISESAKCELKLLVSGTDSTICMVRTFKAPQAESTVDFYDTNWRKNTKGGLLPDLSLMDFTQTPTGYTAKDVEQELQRAGTPFIEAILSQQKQQITCRLNCDDGNPELRQTLKPFLQNELVFEWKEGHFYRIP